VGNGMEKIFSRDKILCLGANAQSLLITEPISEPAHFIPEDRAGFYSETLILALRTAF
jgi:hypothetical protein